MQAGGQGTGGATSVDMPANAAVAGFQAIHEIPGRVTVDNTNTSRLVIIASEEMAAELSLKAVPKIDLNGISAGAFEKLPAQPP